MIENLGVLISKNIFFSLALLRKAKQGISCSISFSLIIIDLKVVSRELLGLANLIKAQTFYIYKLTKVVMVNEDENLVFVAFQVVVPSFKNFNNNQELLIVGFK